MVGLRHVKESILGTDFLTGAGIFTKGIRRWIAVLMRSQKSVQLRLVWLTQKRSMSAGHQGHDASREIFPLQKLQYGHTVLSVSAGRLTRRTVQLRAAGFTRGGEAACRLTDAD